MSDLACITCHFNFADFKRPVNNLHNFLSYMDKVGVEVFGVELFLPNQQPQTKNKKNWIQIKVCPEKNILWQKECLLNIAETLVPDHYTNIAWIDADIEFDDDLWHEKAEEALKAFDIIQLFEKAFLLDHKKNIMLEAHSAFKEHEYVNKDIGVFESFEKTLKKINLPKKTFYKHPGFAWAMKRSLWKKINGLYSRCITGGIDQAMVSIFKKIALDENSKNEIGLNHFHFKKWSERLKYENAKISYLEINLYHFFHGSTENRKYKERNKFSRFFDAFSVANINDVGILEWSNKAPQYLKNNIFDFFKEREEDEILD